MPHIDGIPDERPCGIDKYSPCPGYIKVWRRSHEHPNDYQTYVPDEHGHRPPARGVKIHVLIPKVIKATMPDGTIRKVGGTGHSYVLSFNSHGKLYDVERACERVSIKAATRIQCTDCGITTQNGGVIFMPGVTIGFTCLESGSVCGTTRLPGPCPQIQCCTDDVTVEDPC
jgi:hypothetical protein